MINFLSSYNYLWKLAAGATVMIGILYFSPYSQIDNTNGRKPQHSHFANRSCTTWENTIAFQMRESDEKL